MKVVRLTRCDPKAPNWLRIFSSTTDSWLRAEAPEGSQFEDISDLWSCESPCVNGTIDEVMKEIFAGADNVTSGVGLPDGFPELLADFTGDDDASEEVVAFFEDFMGTAVSNLVSAGVCSALVKSGQELIDMGALQLLQKHCMGRRTRSENGRTSVSGRICMLQVHARTASHA